MILDFDTIKALAQSRANANRYVYIVYKTKDGAYIMQDPKKGMVPASVGTLNKDYWGVYAAYPQ